MDTIVFDLDGTLIDTAPDLIDTLNLVLTREGLPALPFETARPMIGGGTRRLLERAIEAEGRLASKAEVDTIYAGFVEHYAAHIADRSRPYPQLEATLDRLRAAGHRLAVCTNKLEWLAKLLLDRLALTQHFAAICGPDTFGVAKPDPEMLRRTIAHVGGVPEQAVMIGDSSTDVRTAHAAAVPVIAVSFGYADVPVETLRPDHIIDCFAELPEAIEAVVAARA
jgi:phosphoglycolate phosphatase